MTFTAGLGRPRKVWRAVLRLAVAFIPAIVALLPLTLGPAWYLSADENEPFLTPGRVLWMLVAFFIAFAPFLAAAVALLSVRAGGADWVKACHIAAGWAFGLGCVAFVAAMANGGGL